MMPISHESMEQALESAAILVNLGLPARKLLAEAVEASGVKRKQFSKAAKDLETAGFLSVRDSGNLWESQFELVPTLAGEEALEALDEK